MKRFFLSLLFLMMSLLASQAQINTDHMMTIGRNALYFEDYVLSIQYFNQVIKAKPYLAEPYFFRGVAKLYLEDYAGAEDDCSKALERNEFIVKAYICRSFARMKLGDNDGAVSDCNKGLEFDIENKALLYHKGFALVAAKKWTEAEVCLNEMIRRFPTDVDAYMFKGQMNVERGDTLAAIEDFSRTIAIDKFYAPGWASRGWVSLMKDRYSNALADFNEAIRLKSDDATYFMNRALARYNLNDLRGTMDDFDRSISLNPNSKLSYLNRAIMRTNVGDLNRALEDFDKAIFLEPDDYQAIYNRGLVQKDLGHNKEAIADFTTVLTKYPKFTPAYYQRSDLKKRLGDNKGADRDYFAAWNIEEKAKTEKAAGKKSKKTTEVADSTKEMFNINKYNRMIAGVTLDKEQDQYQNPMRGRVQDKLAEIDLEPLFSLTYYEKLKPGPVRRILDLSKYLPEGSSSSIKNWNKLLISNGEQALTSEQADTHFASLDEYSQRISMSPDDANLFFARGLDFALVQDINNAMQDLDRAISLNNKLVLAYFERSILRYRKMNVDYANKLSDDESIVSNPQKRGSSSPAVNIDAATKTGSFTLGEKVFGNDFEFVLRDLDKVLVLEPNFIYAYYNRGNIRCLQRDYRNALIDYTKALDINPDFAEAWFNRGITQIYLGDREHGLADLRMAGQLGLYKAYNIIKRLGD
ncbi:MAG TPA: tetratricopeptide repeat protein [Bacteroidales bacterium]|nr:tetratricopeptide repeat protein [Bacteroidales bacterium]